MAVTCACGQGYVSMIDGKCGHCRTTKEKREIQENRQAYMIGYNQGRKFPSLLDMACPFKKPKKRQAWIDGKNKAQEEDANP